MILIKNNPHTQSAGFTLLELLVVTAVLALLAGAVINSYSGLQEQGQYDVTVFEMAEIRKALNEFRRDSGSNNFPGQGIYDCTDVSNGGAATDVNSNFALMPAEAGSTAAERIAWCQHPANFWMLFENPLSTSWNRDTKRGWNGPYLKRNAGFVDIALTVGSDGDASSGSTIQDVWGIASPFITNNPNFTWRTEAANTDTDLEQFGSPYFMFDLDDDGSAPSTNNPARLISLGNNNSYDGFDNSDCSQTNDTDGFPLDHVVCLLR